MNLGFDSPAAAEMAALSGTMAKLVVAAGRW